MVTCIIVLLYTKYGYTHTGIRYGTGIMHHVYIRVRMRIGSDYVMVRDIYIRYAVPVPYAVYIYTTYIHK